MSHTGRKYGSGQMIMHFVNTKGFKITETDPGESLVKNWMEGGIVMIVRKFKSTLFVKLIGHTRSGPRQDVSN